MVALWLDILQCIINGQLETLQDMVEKNVEINYDAALRLSAEKGHLHLAKYLVNQGADIHACDDYALRMSAINGHLDVVKYLVELGADIKAISHFAIRYSAENGHLHVVKYLVESGADVRACCDYALRWSAVCGRADVVEFLVYEVCYNQTNDFEFKFNKFIRYQSIAGLFEKEYDRRRTIQTTLAEELPIHVLHFYLRPESLRVRYTAQYFGRNFADRQYWE